MAAKKKAVKKSAAKASTPDDRHERFVEEYLKDLNATRAYREVYGVSQKVAEASGSRLLGNAKVSALIEAAKIERSKVTKIDAKYVVDNLVEIVERCMERAPVMVRDSLDGRKFVQKQDVEGRDVWQFDSRGAIAALTTLAKHTGGFTDRVEHSGKIELDQILAGTFGPAK